MEEEKKEKIIRAVKKEDASLKEIAKRLFISEYQLKFLLQSWGVELPKKRSYKRIPIPERKILMEIYNRCGNLQKTAENFGIGSGTVNRWMKKLNIPTRKLKGMTEEEKARYLEKHIEKLEGFSL